MTESLASNDPGAQKRRSTRITQAVPITVTGVDALGQPFKERTTTIGINCHGCKYQSKHYVPKNSVITLEIPRTQAGEPPRSIEGRVIWVQRPRTVRELFQIGVEFDIAGNIWGVAFPPEDWFPYPDDVPAEQPAEAGEAAPSAEPRLSAVPKPSSEPPAVPAFEVPAPAESGVPESSVPTAPIVPESKIHVVPPPAAPAGGAATVSPQEAQMASARQMAKMVAEAKDTLDKTARRSAQSAINDEMTVVRQQLDAQLHEAVERAIKVSMERVSESTVRKVVQQASDRTAAIVEEARKTTNASAAQLDAKVRQAVQEAVGSAAQQAAQQAAEQAAAANLKQTVEQAVERVIAEREASSPSLQILSSPDAAQAQLDQWKKKLEDTAQTTRDEALEQTKADVASATQRMQQEMEAALAGTSAGVSQKLNDAAQAAFAKAEEEFSAKGAGLRETLDRTLANAQYSIQSAATDAQNVVRAVTEDAQKAARSLASELEQERVRAESAKADLRQAAQNALADAEADFASRSVGLRATLDEALANAHGSVKAVTTEAQKTAQSIAGSLEQERARAEAAQAELRRAAQLAIDETRANLDQLLASQKDEIARRTDEVIQERTQLVEPMLHNSAEKVLQHFGQEMDRQVSPKIFDAQRAAAELASATQQAALIRESIGQQARSASEQAIQETMSRLREESAKVPAEIEEASRLVLSKTAQDLEQKASETQHETYEALLKASDWYQKKAHTTMQSALEKAVEQSTSALRDRAAEISSLAASELDHQRRAYVSHAQAQIEESAKEVIDRERGKLSENAEIASTGFANRVNELTADSFKKFEESSRAALEKARSDMEFTREISFAEYEKKLEERIALGIEQARTQLQSKLVPLMEEWDAERESEKRVWMEALKRQTDESIEHYKSRLENASNSWLLASAATLGQNSQAMLDTLARAAEKRIRETCAEVLAGMGDTIKDRLIGISTRFGPDDENAEKPGATPPPAPPKKKP
ncbi:MAG TPA: hypothetical protein VJS43_05635 [Candidatus Acidoferrales bacterium]|nr:hypothetical protein [Candidatus Acidoferrales bacterium]